MKHTLALVLMVFGLVGCSMPQDEKENIAAVTCSIMSETRNMDAAIRVEKMNDARDKIDGEPFLRGDAVIKEAFEWGLCQELVLNETYDERLQSLKDAKREIERIAAEIRAEQNRIAAEKRAEEQKIAAERRAEENRIAAEKRAEEQKIAAEKKRLEEDKRRAEEMEEVSFELFVYKIGTFTQKEATALIKKYGDIGFPAFTEANKNSDELVDLLIGPFVSEQDIQVNIETLNQISGVTAGKITEWNP
jgi:cell division septation protein DedD